MLEPPQLSTTLILTLVLLSSANEILSARCRRRGKPSPRVQVFVQMVSLGGKKNVNSLFSNKVRLLFLLMAFNPFFVGSGVVCS